MQSRELCKKSFNSSTVFVCVEAGLNRPGLDKTGG